MPYVVLGKFSFAVTRCSFIVVNGMYVCGMLSMHLNIIEMFVKFNVCVNVLQISSIHAMPLPSCSSPLFKDMKVARFSASTTPDKQTQVLSSHFAH